MPDLPELRVHGVSGTHPRNMLYTDPRARDAAPPGQPAWTGVFQRPQPGDRAEAFHWGGVTSGSPMTALWLLLLPFALLNTAGWMPAPRALRPLFVASIRLAGLMLTGVFVLQGLTVLFDLPWHGLGGEPIHPFLAWAWTEPRWTGAGLLLIAMLLFGLVTRVASGSHFESRSTAWQRIWAPSVTSMIPDSTNAADVSVSALSPSGDEMWSRHATPERLARLHVGFGLTMIGTVGAGAAAGGLLDAPATLAGALNLGMVGVIAAITVISSLARGRGLIDRVIVWIPLTSLAVALVGLGAFALGDTLPGTRVPALYDLAFTAIIFLTASVIAAFLTGFSTRPAALVAIGAVVGGGLGAGLAAALAQSLSLEGALPAGLGWFAAASLYGYLLIASGLAFLMALSARPRAHPLAAMRGAISRVGLLFNVVFVATVGVVTVVVALRRSDLFLADLPPIDDFSPELGRGALIIFLATALLLVIAFIRMGRVPLALLTMAGFGVVLALIRIGLPETRILGIPLDLGTFPAIASSTAVLVPASLIVTSLVGGLRDADRRRGVGILWDLAGMWPRWYHPFAPPPYGPKVIHDLSREVEERLVERRLLLAAHSQGSVLGAIVVRRLSRDSRSRLAFLTYGSPLASLYGQFFPAHFGTEWLSGLADDLTAGNRRRWHNLWRDSDPIGGPVVGVDDEGAMVGMCRGHSGYEVEERYRAIRSSLSS